jgi:pyruvate formate lyase activating enzyme
MSERKVGFMSIIGRIHSLESFGAVDGPGIRFVVFLQGCLLRCRYCHNPDTWDPKKGIEYSPEQLAEEILKYKSYMDYSGGGVTFTGGEPLLQAEFLLEVCGLLKERGISVAVDTSGFVWNDAVQRLLENIDLVLLDIKNFDPDIYRQLTGVSLQPTLNLLDYLKENNIPTWVRYVLVPQLTDNLDSIKRLSSYLAGYPNVTRIELLGFHKLGEFKWKELGLDYTLSETKEPDKELLMKVKDILEASGKQVSVNL